MKRFSDARTFEVYQTGFHRSLPSHVARKAFWILQLLKAATQKKDLKVIGSVTYVAKRRREGIEISGKWVVTFVWEDIVGATEIKIERE